VFIGVFLALRQQQLEQLQKELSFLEEDIKRVEVKQPNAKCKGGGGL